MEWKKGWGKLGFLQLLLGIWCVEDLKMKMGFVVCMCIFEMIFDGKFICLIVDWDIGEGVKSYQEVVYYGVDCDRVVLFWSFMFDGGIL